MPSRRVLVVLLVVACLALVAVAMSVGASHGEDQTNYTVEPDDRNPGETDVDYEQWVELRQSIGNHQGIEDPERFVFTYPDGGFQTCDDNVFTSTTLEVNKSGGSTQPYDYSTEFNETTAVFEITSPDDAPSYRVDDILYVEIDCVDNPEEEGWYQIQMFAEGEAHTEGLYVELDTDSHYFGVCEGCANDSDARDALGPPPSEPEPTPTQTPDETPDPSPTATPMVTPTEPTATGTDTSDPTPTATSPSPTDTPGDSEDGMDLLGIALALSVLAVLGLFALAMIVIRNT